MGEPRRGCLERICCYLPKMVIVPPGLQTVSEDDLCDCGSIQDEAHLLVCPNAGATCNEQDLLLVNDAAIQVAEYWKRSI
ncbi:hypothetical protein M8J77_000757 [Diaphorina citri]|nr:hypothetical protein M8J77_000757 [Diaphorina citri]